ncbi:MAG: WecB/TagA/CpsF family glycosyltransferase [Rhodospirillales bacterium]|nr:WecB/TagA/CpsF family glycosyltransferase [Rhodospirillales bacterium]
MTERCDDMMNGSSFSLQKIEGLGVAVNPGNIAEYVKYVDSLVTWQRRDQIFYANLHSLYLCLRDPAVNELFRGATVMIDGMPIVAMLRTIGLRLSRHERVTWVDFIWPLLQRAHVRGWRVFWVGNESADLKAGLAVIRSRLPGLVIDGADGYFDSSAGASESRAVVDRINAFGADVCIVGMGTPRQERWIMDNRDNIDAPAVLAAGACMEYLAGAVATPPRWMGRWGLEWAYRLMENPARFGRRYLIEPWALLALITLRCLGVGKHRRRMAPRRQEPAAN